MIADKLISRLEGVRNTGQDRWIARCPAHDDKSPSLAIREIDDKVLLHCFAGCDVYEVVSSVGLELSDLFPEQINIEGSKPIKKNRFPAEAILQALAEEFVIAELGLAAIADGGTLNEKAQARMKLASNRFTSARIAGGLF